MMVIVAVEALPVGGKPPAAVSVCISTGERHGFGAAVPLFTRALYLEQGKAGGPVKSSPKLIRHIWSGSTWFAEELSPLIARSAATPPIQLRVLVCDGTSASMARRGCRAFCSRPARRCFVALISSISSSNLSKWLFISFSCLSNPSSKSRYTSANVGWLGPNSSCWGTGPLPSETALLQFRGILG